MAVVNFLFGNTTASGFTLEGAVSFDADLTISEQHEREAAITEHPVEDGSTISDHVILAPERVTLSGFVTDAGMRGPDPGNTQAAFNKLDAAWASREVMQIVTGRKTYEDMILVSTSLPRERPESMQFTLEFQQIRLVTPEVVEGILSAAQVSEQDTRDLAQPEVDAGAQRSQRITDEQRFGRVEERFREIDSGLFRLGQGVGVIE